MQVRDVALSERNDVDAGEGEALEESGGVLLVATANLHERHVLVDGQPVAGSFFDFGLTIFHNARTQLEQGTGPYFYLPKLESHKEARLWNSVFNFAEDRLNIPRGVISPTVLIEHILAAFEMEEILLFPYLAEDDPFRKRVELEHRELREMKEAIASSHHNLSAEQLEKFCEVLEGHIRFEERELFQHLQAILDSEELEVLEEKIHSMHHKVEDTWEDRFWS
jgi:hypothetical protein